MIIKKTLPKRWNTEWRKSLRDSPGSGPLYAGPKGWAPAQMSSLLLSPKPPIRRQPPPQVHPFLERGRALPRGANLSILPKPWKGLAGMTKTSWRGRFLKAWSCGPRWTLTWTSRPGRRGETNLDEGFPKKNCLDGSDFNKFKNGAIKPRLKQLYICKYKSLSLFIYSVYNSDSFSLT